MAEPSLKAMALHLAYRADEVHTVPPVVHGWYARETLDDLAQAVAPDVIRRVVDLMLSLEGHGMPDLAFWSDDRLRFAECKSSTDRLSWQQRQAITTLRSLPNTSCVVLASLGWRDYDLSD